MRNTCEETRKCNIAPDGMKCVDDEYSEDCIRCQVHALYYALNELWRSFRFLKKYIKEYECPDFQKRTETRKENT